MDVDKVVAEMEFAVGFANALIKVKRAANAEEGTILTVSETRALLQGVKLLQAGRPNEN